MDQFDLQNTDFTHLTQEENHMDCDSVWDLLSIFADGEACPEEAEIVESHVAVCDACRRDLEFMQGTSVALHQTAEVLPPASLRETILAATVNRRSLSERIADMILNRLSPAPVRYGALAAAGAAAAFAFATLRSNTGMEAAAPQANSAVVAGIPTPSAAAPTISEILGTHRAEPAGHSARRQAHSVRLMTAEVRHADSHRIAVAAKPAPQPRRNSTGRNAGHETADDTIPSDVTFDDSHAIANAANSTGNSVVNEPSAVVNSLPTPAPTTVAERPRIVLAAASAGVDPSQVATLAQLRRQLNQRAGTVSNVAFAKPGLRDGMVQIDVLKGSF